MSHSLWWMQEKLIEQQFGQQMKEAREAADQAQNKNQDNQLELFKSSALLKFLERSHELKKTIADKNK